MRARGIGSHGRLSGKAVSRPSARGRVVVGGKFSRTSDVSAGASRPDAPKVAVPGKCRGARTLMRSLPDLRIIRPITYLLARFPAGVGFPETKALAHSCPVRLASSPTLDPSSSVLLMKNSYNITRVQSLQEGGPFQCAIAKWTCPIGGAGSDTNTMHRSPGP